MKTSVKIALVAAGYVLAALLAGAVLAVYMAANDTPDRQASGGMSAFGDSLLFLAVFGAAAMLPTGAGLYFLRAWAGFWRPLALTAAAITATGVVALAVYLVSQRAGAPPMTQAWSGFAALRIFAAPLFAMAFLPAGIFAPRRGPRIALLCAAALEAMVFGLTALIWILSVGMR